MEVRREREGIRIPIAPAISRTPVADTTQAALGKLGGTIRLRSRRLFPQ